MLIDKRVTKNDDFVFLLHISSDDQTSPQVHMGTDSDLSVCGTWRNEYGKVYLVARINTHSDEDMVGRSVRFLDIPKPVVEPRLEWKSQLRPFVYIAAPFTIGDNAENIRNAMNAAEHLIRLGALPFNPLLLNAHYIVHHRTWDEAMQICFSYLAKCDMVWRIPGKSKGADEECDFALSLNISVYHDQDSLERAIIERKGMRK